MHVCGHTPVCSRAGAGACGEQLSSGADASMPNTTGPLLACRKCGRAASDADDVQTMKGCGSGHGHGSRNDDDEAQADRLQSESEMSHSFREICPRHAHTADQLAPRPGAHTSRPPHRMSTLRARITTDAFLPL
eukprot:3603240-Rhodomonas_salina.2